MLCLIPESNKERKINIKKIIFWFQHKKNSYKFIYF